MWTVTKTRTQDEWLEDYVVAALNSRPPSLPDRYQRVGAVDVTWFQTESGQFFLNVEGGNTPDDRVFARQFVGAQLKAHGFKQAQYSFDHKLSCECDTDYCKGSCVDCWKHGMPCTKCEGTDLVPAHGWWDKESSVKTSKWSDIMAKAKRLIQSGQVQLLRNGYNNIVAQVQGDHGDYQSEISRDDPNSRAITGWQCDCPWDQYAWQRTRQWKKYEGRPCAHILAAYWKALSTPLDEDVHPAGQGGQPGQMSLFNQAPGTALPPAGVMPIAQPMMAPPAQGVQMPIPGAVPGTAQGVPDPGIIPPFPMQGMDPNAQPVVSIPGAKPQTPLNPVQYPGGTFSKVAMLQNGDIAQLLVDEMGIAEGKSEEHGAGQWRDIPAGSTGEVMGQDPTTGFIEMIFPLHDSGPMEPYHVRVFLSPNQVKARPEVLKPGPFIQRKK